MIKKIRRRSIGEKKKYKQNHVEGRTRKEREREAGRKEGGREGRRKRAIQVLLH